MYLDFFSLYFFFWIRQSFSWKGQETLSCRDQEIPPAVFPVEQRSRADVCPWVSTTALSTSLSTDMRQTRITWINLEHTLLLLPLAGESASTCWAQCWELSVTVCKEGTSLTWWVMMELRSDLKTWTYTSYTEWAPLLMLEDTKGEPRVTWEWFHINKITIQLNSLFWNIKCSYAIIHQ